MAASDHLSHFVRDALAQGHGESRIREALVQAGWSAPEIDGALGGWRQGGSLPPIPRAQPYLSARESMLYALLAVALAVVCYHVVRLGFHLIDRAVPDPAAPGGVENWSVRFSIAALVGFLPLFVLLDLRMARRQGQGPQRRRSRARRIFASVAVFVAALVLLGDVVAAVHAFLSGDLTARLALKCALVAIIGLLVLGCYREDLDD